MTDTAQDAPFDMPAHGTWEERGGWVVNALAADYELDLVRAAAIVGNCGYESVGFTKLQEISPLVAGSAGGYGYAQWTGPRRRKFEAWCQSQGLDPASDEANYGYLCEELDGDYAYCLADLRKLPDSDEAELLHRAVFLWGRLYEAPAGTTETHLPGFDGRLSYAQRALSGAKAAGPAPTAAPAPGPSVAAAAPSAPSLVDEAVDLVKSVL